MSSRERFPPAFRRRNVTDHSVSSILGPETAARRPLPVAAEVPPSGELRRKISRTTDTVDSDRPNFAGLTPLLFDDLGDISTAEGRTDSTHRQAGLSSFLSVGLFPEVERVTGLIACRNDSGLVHQLYRPWRGNQNSEVDEPPTDWQQVTESSQRWKSGYRVTAENGSDGTHRVGSVLVNRVDQLLRGDRKNSEADVAYTRPVLPSFEIQTVGFGTSAAGSAEDGFQVKMRLILQPPNRIN